MGYFVRIIQASRAILWIRNAEFSEYLFLNEYEHTKGDFQTHYCRFKGD